MEHLMLPENNCPMLKAGLCELSLTNSGDLQAKIEQLQAELDKAGKCESCGEAISSYCRRCERQWAS